MYDKWVSECERMINTYQMKGITIEPTGNSEKAEPQMGSELPVGSIVIPLIDHIRILGIGLELACNEG